MRSQDHVGISVGARMLLGTLGVTYLDTVYRVHVSPLCSIDAGLLLFVICSPCKVFGMISICQLPRLKTI